MASSHLFSNFISDSRSKNKDLAYVKKISRLSQSEDSDKIIFLCATQKSNGQKQEALLFLSFRDNC